MGTPCAMRVTLMPIGLQELRQVERGRLALDVGVRGEDDLLGRLALEPDEELADLEVAGADAVERRERAVEDVVAPAELVGPLDGEEVGDALDDAEEPRVAIRSSGRWGRDPDR